MTDTESSLSPSDQATQPVASSKASTTRILVSGDQELDRCAIAALLKTQAGLSVLGEARTGRETIKQYLRHRHNVIVVDIRSDKSPPASVLQELRDNLPMARVLALAPHGRQECLILNPAAQNHLDTNHGHSCCGILECSSIALMEGALGVIHRDASLDDFFQAVRTVAAGRAWLSGPERWETILKQLNSRRFDPVELLTKREKAIAACVGKGFCNKEIASGLGIAEQTVKKHIGHILKKLHLQDRLQLGLCVVRHPVFFNHADPFSESSPDSSGVL